MCIGVKVVFYTLKAKYPAHLGVVQKIKQDLIHKAKVKKSYGKLKDREPIGKSTAYHPEDVSNNEEPASLELHPDRQIMLDVPEADRSEPKENLEPSQARARVRRSKPMPFEREVKLAQQRKEEAEARTEAIQEATRQRQQKIEERERFRKAMAKARTGGPNGQRKLGRESGVLLEKVKKMMGT